MWINPGFLELFSFSRLPSSDFYMFATPDRLVISLISLVVFFRTSLILLAVVLGALAYPYVRNPMAVAGLGQGVAVALILTSMEVALYCIVGMLIWNYFVRPVEEKTFAIILERPLPGTPRRCIAGASG